MKLSLAFLIVAFSFNVNASMLDDLGKKVKAAIPQNLEAVKRDADSMIQPGDDEPQPPSDVKPIRYAKARVKIQKAVFTKQPNGSYAHVTSLVCIAEGETPVYDFRNQKTNFVLSTPIQCDSTLRGIPVKINVFGIVAFMKGELIDSIEEGKMMWAGLWIENPPTNTDYPFAGSGAATKELNVSSFVTTMAPNVVVACSASSGKPTECRTNFEEYFTAVFDVLDNVR